MYPTLINVVTTFSELKSKEVINIRDGSLLGCISDIEFNTCTGEICSVILPGNGIFSSLSSKNRIIIPWRDIERIGKDTILVRFECEVPNK
ncbi:MAG: YlmC/YmxH family sporulation protein [Clostridia bacterium]|nr:YlmC/YmxH family sporulation protein [Clostridia bacterium]